MFLKNEYPDLTSTSGSDWVAKSDLSQIWPEIMLASYLGFIINMYRIFSMLFQYIWSIFITKSKSYILEV